MASILKRIRPYWRRFGYFHGTVLFSQLRNSYRLPKGVQYDVSIPGLNQKISLRAGTSDRSVIDQIFLGPSIDSILDFEPKTILDLGANIGITSIYLTNRFPRAEIVAVEVDSENVEILRKNVSGYPQISVVAKAVWAVSGFVKITNPTAEPYSFQVEPTHERVAGSISCVSIPELIHQIGGTKIDLIKMDIEGAEKEIFESRSFEWLGRVRVLLVELHDRFKPGCEEALSHALSAFKHQRSTVGEYQCIKFIDY